VPWAPGDEQVAATAASLRAALPGWGVWWDPFALVWVAVRGRRDPPVTASTSAGLLRRVAATAGGHVMSDSSELTEALKARGLMAAASGRSVRAWRPGAPDDVILVSPGWAAGGAALWTWQHGGTAGSHPRGDIAGAADAVAAFLRADPP
jgi:hypothetical protein